MNNSGHILHKLIRYYADHLKAVGGLNGDKGEEELYKWEFVAKQYGHPDTTAADFGQEIKSLKFENLCYSTQITAVWTYAKMYPEEYRECFVRLFDEETDLQLRITDFISSCERIWEKIAPTLPKETKPMCDERLISCFLTFHNPDKYTFYMDKVYGTFCELLAEKKRPAGKKLVHYYELLNKRLIPEMVKEGTLMDIVNKETDAKGLHRSDLLTAQTFLWHIRRCVEKDGTGSITTLLHNLCAITEIHDANKTEVMKYEKYIKLLKANKNIVLTGAPGTGKTYLAKAIAKAMGAEVGFVQFHPSFDYTDFVEGLRPTSDNGFERKDGVFKAFCRRAACENHPDKTYFKRIEEQRPYVFIIDEINRGEISKIFGELFFSIDSGYRGKKGLIQTQYQNLITDNRDYFFEGFFVPENVYIIGTMNDIDRSVESMDFAIRRRFTWIEVSAEESADNMGLPQDRKDRMQRLNGVVRNMEELGEAYQLGAAYFLGSEMSDEDRWKYRIEPLLKEYLRGMDDSKTKLKELENAYRCEVNGNENNG